MYFCRVEDYFSFPSMLPKHTYSNIEGRRALAGETVLPEGPPHSRCLPPIPASATKFTHWNPRTCFLPALNQSGIRAPVTSVHSRVTLKLWGRHTFPSFWLPPRMHFQQHSTHPHGSPASTQGDAWPSPPQFSLLAHRNWIEKAIKNASSVSCFAKKLSVGI